MATFGLTSSISYFPGPKILSSVACSAFKKAETRLEENQPTAQVVIYVVSAFHPLLPLDTAATTAE